MTFSETGAKRHTNVIQVDDLAMRYGDHDVLRDVSFTVSAGEVVALLGPNGAGKTTTIEILEGFRMRSGGAIDVLGADPASADESWRARSGVVLQSWRDHPRWTPRRLLAHLGRYYLPFSTPEKPRPREVVDLLALVGLSEQADQRIVTMSGGQRRRLDVAVGIVGRPELLFLDEPTTGFDPQARREFHQLVRNLAAEEATTIVLTTHDLAEAEKLADRILILAGGRIVANGTAEELARQVQGLTQVRWRRGSETTVQQTAEPVQFVRQLLADNDDIDDLEIRHTSLEDTYLAMVQQHESGGAESARAVFATEPQEVRQ